MCEMDSHIKHMCKIDSQLKALQKVSSCIILEQDLYSFMMDFYSKNQVETTLFAI